MPDTPIGPDGQPVQSLLDLVQPQMPAGGWAPDWVMQRLAAWNRDAPAGSKSSDIGFGTNAGQLLPYLNPANWGPPPTAKGLSGGQQGWFPQEFSGGGNDPTGKFWTQSAYANQFPGGPGGAAIDERPNTLNWHLLGNEPGNFMVGGHPISQSKLYYDTHRPISDPPTAGSLFPYRGFPDASAWSTTGEVGYPGQLDPFATSWGAGGPGSG